MTFYTVNDLSIDFMPVSSALALLPRWFKPVLDRFWSEGACIAIAGGFVTYCTGYTTEFGDIDIFMDGDMLDVFMKRLLKANPICHLNRIRKGTGGCDLENGVDVFNIWSGSQKTPLQVIVNTVSISMEEYLMADWDESNGVTFVRSILKKFDLDICRVGIYNHKYILSNWGRYCRGGDINTISTFMESDKDGFINRKTCSVANNTEVADTCRISPITMKRVIKYIKRLNYGHFSQFPVPLERLSYLDYVTIERRAIEQRREERGVNNQRPPPIPEGGLER